MSQPPLKKNTSKKPAAIKNRPAYHASTQIIDTNQAQDMDLTDPRLYIHRELSQLEFNRRVLEQALSVGHPLLERLKFLLIFSSNLDEFFEIRVAGLKKQLTYAQAQGTVNACAIQQLLQNISETVKTLVDRQYAILNDNLLPALRQEKIIFLPRAEWTEEIAQWVQSYFRTDVLPLITPIALDPTHPFPLLVNKSLNFMVELEGVDAYGRDSGLAIIPAPRMLPRVIRLPETATSQEARYVFLSSVIHAHANEFFPGMTVKGCYQFRLTRNADLSVDADEVEDLARALRGELFSRRFGDAVRLEVVDTCPPDLSAYLLRQFKLTENELYRVNGPVNLTRLFGVTNMPNHLDLQYKAFTPKTPSTLKSGNIFAAVAKKDILLLHPYESFTPVIDFLREAAKDPKVLAIKQTLYRTGGNSEIVEALAEAARNGKEVTVIIELRARFDEESNLQLASRLQEAGAVVIYGVIGFKTHTKMLFVLRREGEELRRYAHLGTGNYHSGNARLYTDYSLITADNDLCEDVQRLFNQLIGMGTTANMTKLLHAPFTLKPRLLDWIEREIEQAKLGQKARISVKVNGLTEPDVIQALYRASQSGVQVDLMVRGMCCLRPGILGLSENIRVRSIIGRFLEHSRIYAFYNGGEEKVYLSSADWMERNLEHRVETCFPIEHPKLRQRVLDDLALYWADNTHAWCLDANGTYHLPELQGEAINAQEVMLQGLS